MMNCGKKMKLILLLKSYQFRTMRNHRLFILGLYSICGCGIIRCEILGLGEMVEWRCFSRHRSNLCQQSIIRTFTSW